MKSVSALTWPLRASPVLRSAGSYPMQVPTCNRHYEHATVALHLHDYAGWLWIGKQRFRLQPGDVTLSPGHPGSRYELAQSGRHLCIHFYPVKAPRGAQRVRLPLHLSLGLRASQARERLWRVIDYHWQGRENRDLSAAGAASAALQEMLLWLNLQRREGRAQPSAGRQEEVLDRLRGIIEHSLTRPLTIPELIAPTGLSADYVARLFRQRYGMTLPRHLLLKRIELARHLLVSSDLSIRDVGRQSGIPDPQYFNKQFRRVTGLSPSAYRDSAGR